MSEGPGRAPAALINDVHVAVIGAGVGGLTLALCLRHAGFPNVTVFEAQPAIPAAPSWLLELNANASRVLHALGLAGALGAIATQPTFAYTRAAASGFVLQQRPLGDFAAARYGAPCYLIDANELRRLLATACAEHDVELVFGQSVDDVDTQTGELTLAGEAHHTRAFAAVIAATGRHAPLASIVSPAPAPRAPTLTVLRARSTRPLELNAVLTWSGTESFCLQYPHGTERTELLLVTRAGAAPVADPAAALEASLRGSHRQLAAALDTLEHVEQVAADDARPRDYWYAGRLALLGDACHALTPAQPIGAAAAIEDAWVLAVMMERWDETPHEGYAEYQRYRLPRVQKLQRGADELIDELLLAPGRATFLRNLRWGLTSRYLPEISMAKLDWLYGYDCIKGFA